MLFQQLVVFLVFFGLVLALPQDDSPISYVTVRNDIYSTEYMTVTTTGEPPAETPVEEPSSSTYTTAWSTDVVYPTGAPSSYSNSNSTVSGTIAPSGNFTVPSGTNTFAPSATAPSDSGAPPLKVSSSLLLALVAVYAMIL